ncbi:MULTISPECIES: agmatinase [unclassified Oceanobacter]|uniref:agmatinase n=1 Tax=unclassified Oceanobacter TaxID=2620260 RepID=UPI0026E4645E|nr:MULTISPECIES: agmatinase [unclassified Oceanobacter]MDO6682670.1 agmatinase [Oceanobacter sp. 5_MG-2023]MDP2505824.1 agmatinase [Oceanobacter sp. 3_MG-2023]MDP2549338.1 agmatinase [Oceanobacter sp. 4_MG-2023]
MYPTSASHNPLATSSANADLPLYGALGMTFMQCPLMTDIRTSLADVIVAGVPFDMATSGRPGARFGPQGVRQASANLIWEGKRWPWTFALDDVLKLEDAGNLAFRHGEPQTLVDNLEAFAAALVQAGKKTLFLGGDHFVTLPILRAQAKQHGPLALIHFDAHTDTYDGGSQYDHGTLFHHAVVEGLVDTEHSIQLGIRTAYESDGHPFEVIDAAELNDLGPAATLTRIRQRVAGRPVYISFDIDALDPAFAPGTGTPVSAGLTMDGALKIIRGLAGMDIRGMDVVEVAPAYDHAEITSLAGATLALDMLYAVAAGKMQAGLPAA